MNRKISITKHKIYENQRETVLEIIQKMIHSKSLQEYNALYEDLKNTRIESIILYFNSQWHNCVNEWTMFGRNLNNHYLNTTTNRLESLNQKLKLVVNKYSNLVRFFKDLNITVNVLASERDNRIVKDTMKKTKC